MSSNKLQILLKCLTRNKERLLPLLQPKSRSFNSLSYPCNATTKNFRILVCDDRISLGQPATSNSTVHIHLITKRFKKGRGTRKESSDTNSDDEGEDDDGEDELVDENPLLADDVLDSGRDGGENFTIEVGSLRLDSFAKVAFGTTRAKIEELYYKGDIYVNGEKASKKSLDLYQNDEIDLVLGKNSDDHNMIDIKRAQLIKLPDKTNEAGRMRVKIVRWNLLTVKPHDKSED